MSKYKGLFTFDVDNHRYLPIEQADGLISDMFYNPEPKKEQKEFFAISPYKQEGYEVFPYDNFGHIYKLAEELGIAFKTREEVEKAVEKLKAWKRLKNAGFKFTDWSRDICEVSINAEIHDDGTMGMINELNLLFGGEE